VDGVQVAANRSAVPDVTERRTQGDRAIKRFGA
jgi:hypothetical protein